jgi:hypothetical protein
MLHNHHCRCFSEQKISAVVLGLAGFHEQQALSFLRVQPRSAQQEYLYQHLLSAA